MLRAARCASLTLITIASLALLAPCSLAAGNPVSGQESAASSGKKPLDTGGTKLLIAFDAYSWRSSERKERRKEFDQALKDAKVEVLTTFQYGRYLLIDCGEKDPADIANQIPNHGGAMAFRDGKLGSVMATHDKKKIPKKYVMLQWGSSSTGIKRMQADVEKYSKMPEVVAEKINRAPGQKLYGNPWMLKVTPGKGKTLLDVFLLTEGKFDYEVFESDK